MSDVWAVKTSTMIKQSRLSLEGGVELLAQGLHPNRNDTPAWEVSEVDPFVTATHLYEISIWTIKTRREK